MATSDASAIELRPVNVSKFEEQISRKWLQAALAGDFASAWSASDEIQRQGRTRLCRRLLRRRQSRLADMLAAPRL